MPPVSGVNRAGAERGIIIILSFHGGMVKFHEGFRERPLVDLAICFVIGTGLRFIFSVAWYNLLSAFLISFILALICRLRSSGKLCRALTDGFCIITAAWLIALLHPLNYDLTEITGSIPESGRQVEITGVIASDLDVDVADDENSLVRRRFEFRVEGVKEDGGRWRKTGANITVFWRGFQWVKMPEYGEKWFVAGKLKPSKGSGSVAKEGSYCLQTDFRDTVFLGSGHGWRLARFCFNARRSAAKRLGAGIEENHDEVALLYALLLGYRGVLSKKMQEIFKETGTMHIFAISGLNVAIIAMFIRWVIKWFRVSSIHWVLYMAPLLILFTLGTGGEASAVRACIMAITYYLAPLLRRKGDMFSSLAFSAILILGVAPEQVFDMGFVYSFTAVIGIGVMTPLFERPVCKWWHADPFRIQPESRFVTCCRWLIKQICSMMAVSNAAWLVSIPLTAYFFGRLVFIALLSNLVVVPLTFYIIFTGCLSLILGLWIEPLGILLNRLNLLFAKTLIGVMDAATRVPFGNIEIAKPGIFMVFLSYLALGLACIWAWRKMVDIDSNKSEYCANHQKPL